MNGWSKAKIDIKIFLIILEIHLERKISNIEKIVVKSILDN